MSDSDRVEIELLLKSGLFDPDWYAATYADVARTGLLPAEHFLRIGRRIGRRGSESGTYPVRDHLPPPAEASEFKQLPHLRRRAAPPVLNRELRTAITHTGLFDEQWYAAQYGPLIINHDDLLQDYLDSFIADPARDPGPLFSTEYYAVTHQDIGDHPLVHFALHGIHEGRPAFPAAKVNTMFDSLEVTRTSAFANVVAADQPAIVLYWDEGNFFFTEIAEYTATYLRSLGIEADARSDIPQSQLAGRTVIIVAPHEFCVYGPGRSWSSAHLGRAIYLNTEQWHTSWFVLAFGFLLQSRQVIDINPASAAALSALGLNSAFMPLLPLQGSCFEHPNQALSDQLTLYKAVKPLDYPADIMDRTYDVLFVGVSNQRRAKALAALAPFLQRHDCFLHAPVFQRPVRPGDPDMVNNADLAQIGRNSKILLNIHQGESHYFEWHRLVLSGIMEGCVVVTEPSHPTGILTPGQHYLEATVEQMGPLIERLLGTPDGQATLRDIHSNCRSLRERVKEEGTLS